MYTLVMGKLYVQFKEKHFLEMSDQTIDDVDTRKCESKIMEVD